MVLGSGLCKCVVYSCLRMKLAMADSEFLALLEVRSERLEVRNGFAALARAHNFCGLPLEARCKNYLCCFRSSLLERTR